MSLPTLPITLLHSQRRCSVISRTTPGRATLLVCSYSVGAILMANAMRSWSIPTSTNLHRCATFSTTTNIVASGLKLSAHLSAKYSTITICLLPGVSSCPFLSEKPGMAKCSINSTDLMQSILGNTRKADITFYGGGRICISARVSKLLALAHGDVIDIMADKGETYLYVKHRAPLIGRHEGMVFRSNKNGNHCVASSARLCRFIISQSGATDSKVRLCCGDPVTLSHYGIALPIIIKHILYD